MSIIDPIILSQELMRCPSVTPEDAGALDVLQKALEGLGFRCIRSVFEESGTEPVDNLYARLGEDSPNLCFAGHTDVVPVGDEKAWEVDPFAAEIKEGMLIGRGAVDMKPAIAAWVAAASEFIAEHSPKGSISLLITGDEEGIAINGTRKMLQYIKEQGENIDAAIVGEPTNPEKIGDMVKIGRRGSITFKLIVKGTQGHVAYPALAKNPVTEITNILHALKENALDEGNEHFQPSNLEVTTVDVGNGADNVIPAEAKAAFNIRFNDLHSSDSLIKWADEICAANSDNYELNHRVTGEAFLTMPGDFSALVVGAIAKITGNTPELSTAGGTSDARFIKDFCPVVEFGLINETAHKVNEQIAVEDIRTLTKIYKEILLGYFK